MNRKTALLSGAALLGLAGPALPAQAVDGWYFGGEAGINWFNTEDFVRHGQPAFNAHYDDGYVAGLKFGYAYPSGWRPELEFDYRRNDLSRVVAGGFSGGGGGHQSAFSFMGNLWYDVPLPFEGARAWRPYLGAGLGVARVGAINMVANTTPQTGLVNNYETNLAYQFGTGVGYALSPRLTLSADYRFLSVVPGQFNNPSSPAGPLVAKIRSNALMFGFRYAFGPEPVAAPVVAAAPEPPPAPPPVEAPPPKKCPSAPAGFKVDADGCLVPQTIVIQSVNFYTDSSQLTDTAKARLDEVAAGLAGQPGIQLEIDGHTDARASKAHNLKLSDRRAAAVRDYLVAKGVSAGSLSSHGFGAEQPIASNKTEAGRAQNRRVEFKVLSQVPDAVKIQNR